MVEPQHSGTGPCMLAGYKVLHARLLTAGLRPKRQRLDNECSAILTERVHCRRKDRLPIGTAIHTFQNHFVAGLCSVDKTVSLYWWDKLLPHAELTLNMLRSSRINPKLSTHAQMHGLFDVNRTPLAPPGIFRVLVHIKPTEHTTWLFHGADGWYTDSALESYHCYNLWM